MQHKKSMKQQTGHDMKKQKKKKKKKQKKKKKTTKKPRSGQSQEDTKVKQHQNHRFRNMVSAVKTTGRYLDICGALWCSGKASDSRSIGTGFDPH